MDPPVLFGIAAYPIDRILANIATEGPWDLKAMAYEDIDQPTVKISVARSKVRFPKVERPVHRFHDLPQYLVSGTYYRPYATNSLSKHRCLYG